MLTITNKPKKSGTAATPLPIVDTIPTDVLAHMTEGIFQSETLNAMLHKLMAAVDALVQPRTAFFLVFDPNTKALVLKGVRGRSNEPLAQDCLPGKGMVGQAFVQGQSFGDPKTFLAVPLRNHLSTFGVLCLCKSRAALAPKVWDVLLSQIEAAANLLMLRTNPWCEEPTKTNRASPIRRLSAQRSAEESRMNFDNLLQKVIRPVTMMRSSLDIALAHLGDEVSPMVFQPLQSCVRCTDRLSRIVEDLLIAHRLAAGNIKLDPQPFGLHQLIRDAVESLEQRFSHAQFVVDTSSCPEVFIKGNYDQMRLALLHIFENASLYSQHAKPPCIRLSLTSDLRAEIVVQDEGPGMTPEDLARVFEPFFRSRDAIPLAGALGQGCPLARSIVRLHSGDIAIESVPGEGTTVRIWLPVYAGLVGASAQPRFRNRARVPQLMLIDDDTDYTSVLSGFMEQRGYLVETSQLVPGLMEDILRHKPTLLLMSMSSQKPEAIQLIREINDHSELSDMSLFVITGCVDAENALDQDICGRIDGFFLKPVSPSFLLSRISEELLKGQMASVFR